MSIKPLYELDEKSREIVLKILLEGEFDGRVTGPKEGGFGEVYSIERGMFRSRLCAKCPRLSKFGNREDAREAIEKLLHEIEKSHQVFMVPWINRINDVKIILGWPFLVSRYRDGTLEDLIANPLAWSLQDKFASLIQIIRALRLARERGIAAHQDLKPSNIFFDDKWRSHPALRDTKGLHFWMHVGDLGLADAFRVFGTNHGSRPYMAPEQFSSDTIDPVVPRLDIFALGVIAHECFTDGLHPIGAPTATIWPWHEGLAKKWNHEDIWKKWARRRVKTLPDPPNNLPPGIGELILAALAVDPSERPSLEAFETRLWRSLDQIDSETHTTLHMQIDHIEGLSAGEDGWPHMESRLMVLRQFYSEV